MNQELDELEAMMLENKFLEELKQSENKDDILQSFHQGFPTFKKDYQIEKAR